MPAARFGDPSLPDTPDAGSLRAGAASREADDEGEQTLIAALRRGDEPAFERLFRSYFDRLQAYAERYVRRPDVAEEMVGSVFLRVWEQRERWEIRQSLKSYLYAAVRNHALMWLDHESVVKRTHGMSEREGRSPGMGQCAPAADDALQARELADALAAAIEKLPPRVRDAYTLNRQHGLSYGEVAQEMGISVKTVEIHMGRALQALRTELVHFLP